MRTAPEPARSVWTPPVSSRSGVGAVAIVGIVLGGFAGLVVLGYFVLSLGTSAVVLAALLALVPLAGVLWTIAWIDRWEPEPRSALVFAFLWGAAVSVAVALLVDLGIQVSALASSGGGELATAAVQAPIVEELAKGIGVLILFAAARSHFDGPVDGLVYAATIAAGFAFTENILYFGAAIAEGDAGGLGATFVLRGIFSPFAHVMFTACIGLALGAAARRGVRGVRALGWFLAGLAPAIALHAIWNGALFLVDDLPAYYVTVQVPLFVLAIVITVRLRRTEIRLTRARLEEYAAVGWFTPQEVEMISTPSGRRRAKAWARAQPPAQRASMRAFIRDATHLAFTRERIATGRAGIGQRADENALLHSIARQRSVLIA